MSSKPVKELKGFEEDLDSSSSDSDGSDAPDGMLDLGRPGIAHDSEDESDDSDLSDSAEEEMEIDPAEAALKLQEINSELESNPMGYDLLVQKIKFLRATGDLQGLRTVREKLNEYYPLSPQLWMEWIRDETKLAETDEEKEQVLSLFERAVADYLSLDIWLEYAKFSMNFMGKENGIQRCRDIFERALAVGGLHTAMGSLLWYAYRDFEAAVLGLPMSETEVKAQENRYIAICKRQLSVPLLGMEEAYAEICEKIEVDDITTEAYASALKKLRCLEEFETQLVQPLVEEQTKAHIYKAYIAAELKEKSNPARIQILYERAVTDVPLDSSLWMEYLQYLSSSLKIPDMLIKVSERATRNCPWVIDLWIMYLQIAEKHESAKIVGIFEKAILNFQAADDIGRLWLKYLECLRRLLKVHNYPEDAVSKFAANIQTGEQHVLQAVAQEPNNYVFQIRMMLVRLNASRNGLKEARDAWKELLERGYGNSFRNWLQYLLIELQHGDTASYRRELSKSVAYVKDDLYSAADLWLNFERDFGDASQLAACEKKISKYIQEVVQYPVDEYQPDNFKNNNSKKKRKMMDTVDGVPDKRKKGNAIVTQNPVDKGEDVVDRDGFKIPAPVQAQEKGKEKSAKKSDTVPVREKVVHDSSKDDRTVFVSNLSYSTDEDALREFFKNVGSISELRLVRDFKGRSKGYAYIVFDSWESAGKALELDRTALGNRPVFVSKCDPNKSTRPSGFKFATKLEKQKLFVKGLPVSYGKSEVENIFKVFGDIVDIRIVTFRNGHSKGMAYVDFQDEFSAAKAVKEIDGKEYEGSAVSVAISNPPPKKDSNSASDVRIFSRKAPTAFVPRSLQVGKGTASASGSKPMSNADFKELLKLKRPANEDQTKTD